MNVVQLSLAYIRARALNAALNVLLLGLGVATIVVLLLFSAQLQGRLARDAAGIDLVVGAKGSPLQLILSSIYHADIPTGNIPLSAATALAANPMVARVVPLALGDSFGGYRLVGTDPSYVETYDGTLRAGRLWQAPYEATLGAAVAAATGLGVGDRFVGSHGIARGGPEHGEAPYTVVGVLARSGSVLDRVVLTSVESVWRTHEMHHEETAGGHDADAGADEDREITALLVRYRSPLAAVSLPRQINSQSALQAASPAFETARLFSLVGVGVDTLRGFGALLIVTAALGVFIALYNAMYERRYDLAVMRCLGATRGTLLLQVVVEGLILAAAGTLLGVALGHGVTELLSRLLPQAAAMGLTGLAWQPGEAWLTLLALGVGVVAAALPALQAYRTDIARTLATR